MHTQVGVLDLLSHSNVCLNGDVSVDVLTSDTSIVPYDLSKLQNMLELSNHLVDYVGSATPSSEVVVVLPAHLVCVLGAVYTMYMALSVYTPEARLMRLFARSKFLNFYGQVTAHLNANRSVYEIEQSGQKATLRLRLANTFLWGAPAAQYKALTNICMDGILNYPKWCKHITNDWNNVTIFSTVMLAVDISFLAIPGIISAAALIIYLPVICPISSLVVSILLAAEIRERCVDSAKGAVRCLLHVMLIHIEALAIMSSLPIAYLIWGMFYFVIALGISVFHSTNLATLVIVSIFWVAVTVLTLWPTWWSKYSITPRSVPSKKRGQARETV
ncbi:hypothetical protein EDB19DRAFT_1911313 [Suillus lakei]|nr:hypothetical protein EDB19DRAFT_1911313 [Suillus lakei]